MNLAWFTGEFQEMMALDMDCCCIAPQQEAKGQACT